jgi:hypothetical protein
MTPLVDIKKLRKTRRITQSQLGQLCGMSKSQISRMENGTLGSPETISRVLNALDYEVKLEIIDRRCIIPPKTEDILETLRRFKESNSKKYGITKLGLFGSYARGEQTPTSDIDICVALDPPSLFKLGGIYSELHELLNKEIDIVSLTGTNKEDFIKELNKDVIYV